MGPRTSLPLNDTRSRGGGSRDRSGVPSLAASGYEIKSEFDSQYNGIAYAAGDKTKWWWPDQYSLYYWPPGIPREATLPRFIEAFAALNYVPCQTPQPEEGCEKVAIYASPGGEPQHAAVQLPSGIWASKRGELEDIEHHALTGIEGQHYGHVVQILKGSR